MKYNISVKQFIEESRLGNIDYDDFCATALEESEKKNAEYNIFREISSSAPKPAARLYGLPVSAKDCICTAGMQSCAGSKILSDYVAPFDATAVKRVKQESGFIIGKTNQDEFGFGTFSTNSRYGVPKNPLDTERSCGGSSGGAAAATALNSPHISLAESTGGSISCPAAFCSAVGLTPTYGLVSRYGLIDYANSLDKIGIIAMQVYAASLMLSVIAGYDYRDSTSLRKERYDYTRHANNANARIRVGIPKEYFSGIDSKVEKPVRSAISRLESMGAKCSKVSLPSTKYALAAYYIIATAEASTNLAKYCGMRYGHALQLEGNFNEYFSSVRSRFGQEAKRRIMLGTFCRMAGYRKAYYLKAMQVRTLVINDFKRSFKKFDVLAAPTMPILPPRFSEIAQLTPLQCYQMDALTVPANLAGIPHLSLPAAQNKPVGLHLLAPHLGEAKLIEVAAAIEGG